MSEKDVILYTEPRVINTKLRDILLLKDENVECRL